MIGIIFSLIQYNLWNKTFNICSPVHPLRKDLYPRLAEKYGYETPQYDLGDNSSYKIINTDKLDKLLEYQYKFPDPEKFTYQQF